MVPIYSGENKNRRHPVIIALLQGKVVTIPIHGSSEDQRETRAYWQDIAAMSNVDYKRNGPTITLRLRRLIR